MDSGSERQKSCVREISVTLGISTSPVPSLSLSRVHETGKEEPTAETKAGEKDAHLRGGATILLDFSREVTGPARS